MSDPKPMTSDDFSKKPDRTINVGENPSDSPTAQPQPRDQSSDQKVKVRALRVFHKDEHMQGDQVHPGDEFETTRSRAAELRANELIEYTDESEEKEGMEDKLNTHKDRVRRNLDAGKIADRNKSPPLKPYEATINTGNPTNEPRRK